jgi:tRNA nucleotidyltransferase (CCA-adding enzyme)
VSEDDGFSGPADGLTEPGSASGDEHLLGRLDVPPAVVWIARTLETHGFETWTVGGAVRDALRERPSGDWDLTTRARPKDVRRVFRRTVPVGVEHGTLGVLARDGTMYEVTTFRRDVMTDGRHAVVSFADRIEDDLARRDFTINAIAWHPLTGSIRDPFGGRRDLRERVLRTVGVPAERFAEDYLRVLRAFRFAGRFGLRIEAETWTALCAAVDSLRRLSAERIRDELLKVLESDPEPSVALDLYATSGALAVLYPELEAMRAFAVQPSSRGGPGRALWEAALARVDALPRGRGLLRLAALLKDLERDQAAALLFRLRLSNAQIDSTLGIVTASELPDPDAGKAEFRRWLSRTAPELRRSVFRIALADARCRGRDGPREGADLRGGSPVRTGREIVASWRRAQEVLQEHPPLTVGDLALDGRGLIALGLKPGPRFGQVLHQLLEWVLEDPARNRPDLLAERVRASEVGPHD